MGNCMSNTSEPEVRPSRNPARFRLTWRKPRLEDAYEAPVNCIQCHRPCGHTEGRFYLKCLECWNPFNICDRCSIYHHPVHVYAYVDNVERHRFMQQIEKRMEGSPILSAVPFVERRSLDTLTCFNLTVDDNGEPEMCRNPVSWMCLQCAVIGYSVCESCMALPSSQHNSEHVFAKASSYYEHNFFMAQQYSGALPLSLDRTEE